MLVIGDSVSWGQGLAERNKYYSQIARSIENSLGEPVNLVIAAHSGATVAPPEGSRPSDEERVTPGEIPNAFPTIMKQIDLAAQRLGPERTADLVLVGGCINDVGASRILNPGTPPAQIAGATNVACGERLELLLHAVGSRFPEALIVLTGYYPLVSNESDLSEVGALLATAGVVGGEAASGLGIPVLDPTTGAIFGAGMTEVARRLAAMNSHLFYVQSTAASAQAARSANERLGGRVSFACAPFTPNNAFTSPESWLWPRPMGFSNDEVYQSRGQLCKRDDVLTTAGSTSGSLPFDRWKCASASMGHPNLLGAQAYTQAILQELHPFIPLWKGRFAQSLMQPAEHNTDRPGDDFRDYSLGQRGWSICQADCASNGDCQSWTFVPAGQGRSTAWCWLKNGVPAPVARTNLVSGVKRLSEAGLENGIDRPGWDYRAFTLPRSDPRLCEQECTGDAVCSAWTYVPAHHWGPQAHCWLKNTVPAPIAAPGLVSGVKQGR